MKGLVTYDRKIKKDAFYWYKANWSHEPVLYISGRRDCNRIEAITTVKVFANISNVTLYVYGNKIGPAEMGTTPHDFVFKSIHLVKGINHLRAEGNYNGKLQSDNIEWTLKD